MQILPLLLACGVLLTGCIIPRIQTSRLGPDRILSDAEVLKVNELIAQADRLWKSRVEPGNADKALETLNESIKIAPHNSQSLWRAARACYWLAERAGEANDKPTQLKLAEQGIDFGKHAIAVDTERKEGYYYLALSYAMRADASPTTGLTLVPTMIKLLKRADEPVGPGLDYSGPDRVMGQIYLQAPPWPTSVGDVDEAMDHLEDACDDHPEFPENNLALGEAYLKIRKYGDARKHLNRVLAAQPAPDWAAELPRLQQRAQEMLAKIPLKK